MFNIDNNNYPQRQLDTIPEEKRNLGIELSSNTPEISSQAHALLATLIEEKKYKEAIGKLLLMLVIPKNFNLEKTFNHIFELFAHMEDDALDPFLKLLPKFLQLASHLLYQQYQLALLLGEFHTKRVHLISMSCFAQAIKIGEKLCDQKLQNEAHIKASELIQYVIQHHFLTLEKFKRQLDKARGEGNPEEFKKLLKRINCLKRYCHNNDGITYIHNLFVQAQEVLIKRGASGEFESIVEVILKDSALSIPLANVNTTEKYERALKEFRNSFAQIYPTQSNFKDLRSFQTYITEKFKDLFQILLEDAFVVLGEPPCDYDIRAIGSVGREEPSLFSDLEFFILIQNEKDREYFISLLHFLELQVISFGETESIFKNLNIKGFYLDQGSSPLKISDLMGPPNEMADLQLRPLITTNEDEQADLTAVPSNQTLKSISLLKSNPSELFDKYQARVKSILESGKERKIRHTRAIQLFKTRYEQFHKIWQGNPHLSNPIQVKDHYLQFLNFLLADMALYFGIKETNTLDIIDVLIQINVFTLSSGLLLKEAVTAIYCLRMRLHQYYQFHQEEAYLDGLTGYVLKTSEKKELEKIYWLILRPLYHTFLSSITERKVPVDAVFSQIDLLTLCFDELFSSSEDPHFFLPLIRFLAKETSVDHLKNFKRLSKRSNLEFLRKEYLSVIENNHVSIPLIDNIYAIPNRAGFRFSFMKKEQELKTRILALTLPINCVSQVKMTSSLGEHYIKPEVIKEIIDEKGDLKRSYSSNHSVTFTGGLHFKQKPVHPLMEFAIHNLFHRIAGDLTPSTELVRFEVGKNKMYPVLISTTIPGKTLKEMRTPPLLEKSAQWARWTWFLLCSILTRPGDGLSSNYLFDSEENIYSVDNDISFVNPIIQKTFSLCINFCSALFCHFQERSLDTTVLEEFCFLHPDSILEGWINDVIKKEEEYLNLFVKEERHRLYHEDHNNRFKATILFKRGTLATLNVQFVDLQNQLLALVKSGEKVTPLILLKQIVYLADNFNISSVSGRKISQFYLEANKFPIDQQLGWITKRPHGNSLSSLKSDEACLGFIPKFEEVENRQSLSIQQAKEELLTSLLHRSVTFFSISLDDVETLKANFKEMNEGEFPDIERQEQVLKALSHLMSLKEKKPIAIALQHCAALNSKLLSSFLHERIRYLDLSFCPQIKNSDIETIQMKCPALRELYLSGCSGLTAIEKRGLFSIHPLVFSTLRVINIANCSNLRAIRLVSPCLSFINVRKKPLVEVLELESYLEIEVVNATNKIFSGTMNLEVAIALYPRILNDKEVIIAAVKRDASVLDHANEEFKNDRDIILAAVNHDVHAIKYITVEFMKDKEIVLAAVKQNGLILEFVGEEFKKDREVVLTAVKQDGKALKYADEQILRDKKFVFNAVLLHEFALIYATDELKNDKEFILTIVNQNGLTLKYVNEQLKKDKDIVLAAVTQNGFALMFLDEDLRKDRDIVHAAVMQNGYAIKYADENLKNNIEIAFAAVTQNGLSFEYFGMTPYSNWGIIFQAVAQNGLSLQYANEDYKKNHEIVFQAVTQNGLALKYADDDLKINKEIVLTAVTQNGLALEYADKKLQSNGEIVSAAIVQNALSIKYAAPNFKSNKLIVLEAVKENGLALEFADYDLQYSRKIVLAAVSQNGLSLKFVEIFTYDIEIVLAAVMQNELALEFANSKFKNNKQIVSIALRQNSQALKFASERLKNDMSFITFAAYSGYEIEYPSYNTTKRSFSTESENEKILDFWNANSSGNEG